MGRINLKVGTGCTYVCGSDRYAYMVVKVIDRKTKHVLVSRAKIGPNKAQWPEQEHDYAIDPDAPTIELEEFHGALRKVTVDPLTKKRHHEPVFWYSYYYLGKAEDYMDPSF